MTGAHAGSSRWQASLQNIRYQTLFGWTKPGALVNEFDLRIEILMLRGYARLADQ